MSISKYFSTVKILSSTSSEKRVPENLTNSASKKEINLKDKSKYFVEDSESSETEIIPDEPHCETSKKPPKAQEEIKIKEKDSGGKIKAKKGKGKGKNKTEGIKDNVFVITGLLKDFSRESLTDKIKDLGGKVTGNVSKNTCYLVHGEKLEDGRNYTQGNKYKKAAELGVNIIDEEGIKKLISEEEELPEIQPVHPTIIKIKPRSPHSIQSSTSVSALWTDKYKPKKSADLIGNSQVVEKLNTWLENWKPKSQASNVKPHENSKARAVLISGPPGIGKTTAARLIAHENGFKVLEMNASDIRSKNKINEVVLGSSVSQSLSLQGDVFRTLVIMDEVDGMAGGDRGGVSALIQIIKETKNPMICICNDRKNPKLKTLANYCYDLRFSRPNKLQITRRVLQILKEEMMTVEPNAVEFLVEASGNDIRQILTALDLWSRTYSEMTYMQAKNSLRIVNKDSTCMINSFEAASKLFNSSEMKKFSNNEKINLAFIDYELIPLLVNESYLQALDPADHKNLAEAADCFVLSDLMSKQIYSQNNWSLLPTYLQESCIHPTQLCKKSIPFPNFPEFFGKLSKTNKNNRLIKELRARLKLTCDSQDFLNEFLPVIYELVLKELRSGDYQNAATTLSALNLDPNLFKENVLGLTGDEEFKEISVAVRKNMTNHFQKFFANSIEKVKAKRQEKPALDQLDPEYQEIPVEEEDSIEDEEIVKPIHIKKR